MVRGCSISPDLVAEEHFEGGNLHHHHHHTHVEHDSDDHTDMVVEAETLNVQAKLHNLDEP